MDINDDNSKCLLAMPYYADYLSDQKDDIPRDIIEHIPGCDACMKEINSLSAMINNPSEELELKADTITRNMELHFAFLNHRITCSDIRPFLPLQASVNLAVNNTTPVTAHISNCPRCSKDLEKIKSLDLEEKQLHELSRIFSEKNEDPDLCFIEDPAVLSEIKSMINRPDACSSILAISDDYSQPEEKFTLRVSGMSKKNTEAKRHHKLTSIISKIAAAAACLIVIFMVFFNNSGLNATDFREMYKSLKDVRNICLKKYGINDSKPIQTTWISNPANLKIMQIKDKISITDLNNNIYKYKNAESPEFISQEILKDELARFKKSMDLPWGLLPFTHTKDLPRSAAWRKVTEESDTKSEVFELTYTRPTGKDEYVYNLWMIYLETDTNLPFKIEFKQKLNPADDYEQISITEITYPDQAEIMAVIDKYEADI